MDIFVLEDMGETEAAQIVIGGLLENGQVTDPHEFRFCPGSWNGSRDRRLSASDCIY